MSILEGIENGGGPRPREIIPWPLVTINDQCSGHQAFTSHSVLRTSVACNMYGRPVCQSAYQPACQSACLHVCMSVRLCKQSICIFDRLTASPVATDMGDV